MKRTIILSAALPLLALSACAESGPGEGGEPGVEEEVGGDLESSTDDNVVTAADFDKLQMGGKIEGPAGPEVEASFVFEPEGQTAISLGNFKSYVSCAANISNCDPAGAAADAIYTYVHVVTPGVDEDNDEAFPKPAEVRPAKNATAFLMSVPSTGFTGEAGYSLNEARAALGPQASFEVKCEEDRLIFELATGEDWATGEPITFFWKSSVPPKGPGEGYRLVVDGDEGVGTGPVPQEGTGEEPGCT